MITYPKPEEVVLYEGRFFTVEWYYTDRGRMPALEYYRAMSEGEQDRLDRMVKYLADAPPGTMLHASMYRIEDRSEKIYALKPGSRRFFNFTTDGRRIIITNAYRKHSQKMSKKDLVAVKTAGEYRRDYLRRVSDGVYYEEV